MTALYAILGFLAAWVGISFLISHLGWREFASRFPARRTEAKKTLVGWLWFDEGVPRRYFAQVAAVDRGLQFEALPIFPFHPPFVLPWNVITIQSRDGLVFPYVEIVTSQPFGSLRALAHGLPTSFPHQKEVPNKAPEPTPTAVTSPAAQEPRQP